MAQEDFFFEVYEIIQEVPLGKVTTYGQVAQLMDRPQNARMVGRALRYASMYGDFPCYKVLNSKGELLPGWPEQKLLLEQEGIEVIENRVDLKKYLWKVK